MNSWKQLNRYLQKEHSVQAVHLLEKWGAIVVVALLLFALVYTWGHTAGGGSKEQEIKVLNTRIKNLNTLAQKMAKERNVARKASAATRAEVAETRDLVRIISPGRLEVKLTPTAEPEQFDIDTVITRALEAERKRVASLEHELSIADSQAVLDSLRTVERDTKIKLLEDQSRCRIMWLLPCPSRKVSAVAGAAAALVAVAAVKITINRATANATKTSVDGGDRIPPEVGTAR